MSRVPLTGPLRGKPVIMPAGTMDDRASLFVAAPDVVIAAMVTLVSYSVPLYRLFYAATGFGGTTQRAAVDVTTVSRHHGSIRCIGCTEPSLAVQCDGSRINVACPNVRSTGLSGSTRARTNSQENMIVSLPSLSINSPMRAAKQVRPSHRQVRVLRRSTAMPESSPMMAPRRWL